MVMVPEAANMPDAVADRDLGAGDLGRGGAAHLAHALLKGVHALQHVRARAMPMACAVVL
jgi:hypothetical protein